MHTVGECFQGVSGIFHGHTHWAFEYPAQLKTLPIGMHGHHSIEFMRTYKVIVSYGITESTQVQTLGAVLHAKCAALPCDMTYVTCYYSRARYCVNAEYTEVC